MKNRHAHMENQMRFELSIRLVSALLLFGASSALSGATPVGSQLSDSKASNGLYISWREHIIDSADIADFNLTGSDGLVMA